MARTPVVKYNAGKPTNVQRAVAGVLLDICVDLQTFLFDNDRIATGESINDIRIDVYKSSYTVTVAGQFQYALTGRKAGKMPPIQPIQEWIEVKGITPDKGSIEGMAWGVAKNIAKFGTNPPHFTKADLAIIIERAYKRYEDRISSFMAQDSLDVLSVIFTKNGFKVEKA